MVQSRGGLKTMLVGVVILFLCGKTISADVTTENSALESITTQTSVPPRSLRLPNTTFPLHYHLHISSNIHLEQFNYSGNATIEIEIRESTNEIVLHSKRLNISKITVQELRTGEVFDDLTYSLDLQSSFLIIHPIENYQVFEAGQLLRVQILYTAEMCNTTFGIYWATYNDVNNRTVYLAATQFEPTSARLAFPCYDEPNFKANMTISITHAAGYFAISNMQVQQVHNHSTNDLATTTFYTTPPISTYLVAFVISDFQYITDEYRGVTQRIYSSSNNLYKGQKALKNTMRTLVAFEDYFGINYPLAKLDHIALKKNFGAAMENWGLITYKEDHLISQDEEDKYKDLRDLLTQSHEIAHQWFGNLVSPEWWTYAWLNEGFATYFSHIITDLIHPEFKVMEFFRMDVADRAFSSNYITVRPMSHYVESESEIVSVFDIVSYQRAACVIKMFHHAFNQKTFVRAISRYLRKFQYSVANEMNLFDSLQTALTEDPSFSEQEWTKSVPQIMQSWTHSKWIPIVSIQRNDNNTITIKQRSKDSNSPEYWWIPLNFATASAPDFERTTVDYFMPPVEEVTIDLMALGIPLHSSDWLIVNKQQTGFYHVLYDDQNLLAIAKQLQSNHTVIHPVNRGVIFQDLCPFMENNEIHSVDVVFELLKYLQNEEDLFTWILVLDTIKVLKENLYGTASYALYKQFIRNLVTPTFKKMFTEPQHMPTNATHVEMLAMSSIMQIACIVDLQDCLDYTREVAFNYIFKNRKFEIEKTLNSYGMVDSILCNGLKYLSDEKFDEILDLLKKLERNTVWYDDMTYAIICTQSRTHLRKYLEFVFQPWAHIMNESDTMMYLLYIYKTNLAARPEVWGFIEREYHMLSSLPLFAETFNRIAEYTPQRHHENLNRLRELLLEEENIEKDVHLISKDSPRIGKKVKIIEAFLYKFGAQIHDWLMRDQLPSTYSASVGSAFGVNSGANRIGALFKSLGRIHRSFQHTRV